MKELGCRIDLSSGRTGQKCWRCRERDRGHPDPGITRQSFGDHYIHGQRAALGGEFPSGLDHELCASDAARRLQPDAVRRTMAGDAAAARSGLTQLNLGTLLGSVHYTRLGQYGSDYFTDPKVQTALDKFQRALTAIEESMNNSGLATTYPYLLPSLIPQSINI